MSTNQKALETALDKVQEARTNLEEARDALRECDGATWDDHDFNGIVRMTGALDFIEANLCDRITPRTVG